jgi:hypothetical protein
MTGSVAGVKLIKAFPVIPIFSILRACFSGDVQMGYLAGWMP